MPNFNTPPSVVHTTCLTMSERLALELNDADNAARLLSVYGADLIFVDGKGWAVWDGARYSFNCGELSAMEIGHNLREIVMAEAEAVRGNVDFLDWQIASRLEQSRTRRTGPILQNADDARDELIREREAKLKAHATKCGNLDKINKALESSKHRRKCTVDNLDNDPYAFVTPSGQIDLRRVAAFDRGAITSPADLTAERATWISPVDRAALPTKCGGVDFDPAAECPRGLILLI